MKINNFRPVNMNPYNKQMEKQDQLQSSKKKDKIEISPEALELQRGNQLELDRQERVNELKSKVQSGEYKVNPEEIAHKMYSFWDDLKKR
jgi:negative regulator of flagellin synthesis FlgM